MEKLFESFEIKGCPIRNRVCFPPMVYYGAGDDSGEVTEKHVEHYRSIAAGGTGLIIQEATCVSRGGRLSFDQLGIWDDGKIQGLKKIVDAVHGEGCPIFVQIHHAGVVGCEKELLCPSDYTLNSEKGVKQGRAMSLEEIRQVQQEFIAAGRGAYEAGYDGIELHGCHRYLICQFLNRRVNRREDVYGREPERFVLEILEGIRKVTPPDFIVGIRLGAFEPTLEDGLRYASILEEQGIDLLDISYGFTGEDEPQAPEGYPYQACIYGAARIKEQVSVPVFAVNSIVTPQMAEEILQTQKVDMVDLCRAVMVDNNWVNDARAGRSTGMCRRCSPCGLRVKGGVCAGKVLLERERAKEEQTC